MASRIMHYIIGDKVANNIKVKDYNRFMFGNLSPDMSSHEDRSYGIFHVGGELNNLKGIDFYKFYADNITNIRCDDFLLGYFSHLLSDAIWLKMVRQQQIRKYDKIEKERRQKLGYKEMWLYNSVLLDIYPTEFKLQNESDIPITFNEKYIKAYLEEIERDFAFKTDVNIEKFEIYPFELIILYINTTINKVSQQILNIYNEKDIMKSEEYYVEK